MGIFSFRGVLEFYMNLIPDGDKQERAGFCGWEAGEGSWRGSWLSWPNKHSARVGLIVILK